MSFLKTTILPLLGSVRMSSGIADVVSKGVAKDETDRDAVSEIEAAPLQPDQEWANALTHGLAAMGTLVVGIPMVALAASKDAGLAIACAAYVGSAFGTFLFSTLSHAILRQPLLNTMRAWDQAMIYTMIAGTYTPIIYFYAGEGIRAPLLSVVWIAAGSGFLGKVAFRHRINSIGTFSYLMLGWMPAVPLVGKVPMTLAGMMLVGGVVYSIGVLFLMNDRKMRYMHAIWHLCVIVAALSHYLAILRYVVDVA